MITFTKFESQIKEFYAQNVKQIICQFIVLKN